METLVARYIPIHSRLRITGNITQEMITEVFIPNHAYSYSPFNPAEGWEGMASFSIAEANALKIVEKINASLASRGACIDYRGRSVVPPEELVKIKTSEQLNSLINRTLSREANRRIKPEELSTYVEPDYSKFSN